MLEDGSKSTTPPDPRDDERSARVAALKRRVHEGTYVVDVEVLASAMLVEAGVSCTMVH
jgi:anti-sigma28 factor (negative regulator of flagellin synthesis)